MKKLTLLGLSAILLMASCSIKKRVYMAGYHVEWNKSKHLPDRENTVKKDKVTLAAQQKNEVVEQVRVENTALDNSLVSTVSDQQVLAYEGKANGMSAKHANFQSKKGSALATKLIQKKVMKAATKAVLKQKSLSSTKGGDDVDLILLYVLCVLIPFVAVGIVTDWDVKQVVINLILSILCWIPGIIHAFIVVGKNR